ncbi:hypothetical protein ACELLULO517_00655 [Acidisoma cellulosilytica]|uniref:Uncharacterized protein n=1 Tax=Acidisoma cellulosilyticum TaxID=2802395 RepID=A0A963YXH4_9PROT|nr:hypothetical protein [Acidisoma cellulosilyticum]MCB8878725.1 hypothetical protein [Acidisoma cellulosilyticum]
MSDNLVLELLRAMRSDLTTVKEDMREVKLRLTALETAVGNLAATEMSHYAITADRVDRLTNRIERIETRLDLREASSLDRDQRKDHPPTKSLLSSDHDLDQIGGAGGDTGFDRRRDVARPLHLARRQAH